MTIPKRLLPKRYPVLPLPSLIGVIFTGNCARNGWKEVLFKLAASAMMVKLPLSKWMSLNISTGNTTVASGGKVTGSLEASSKRHAAASLLLSRTVLKLL